MLSRLAQRSFSEQLAFGICLMERALLGYFDFQQDTGWLGGGDLRAALAESWRCLESTDGPMGGGSSVSAAMCERWTPHSEDHTSPYTSAAIDAVGIACSLVEYLQKGDPALIRDATEARRDTIDLQVQRSMHQELSGIALEQYIAEHPLMRSELETMQEDLCEIIRLFDSGTGLSTGLLRRVCDTRNSRDQMSRQKR